MLLANIHLLTNNIVFEYLRLEAHFYFKSKQAGISLLMLLPLILVKGILATNNPQEPFSKEFPGQAPNYSPIKKLTLNAI